MSGLERIFFVGALGANALAGAVALLRPRALRVASLCAWLGFGALLGLVAIRWVRAGHPPLFGTFEVAVSDGTAVALLSIVWAWLRPAEARAARALGLLAAALLAHGLAFPRAPLPLTISERSLWVDFHAAAAFAACAFYSAAAAVAVAILARRGADRDAGLLGETLYRFLSVGFLFQTGLMALGAWYSVTLFGVFWRWDLIESLAALTWLAYALVIHLRLFYRWRDRRLAVAALIATALALALYKGFPHLGRGLSYHVFDVDLGR